MLELIINALQPYVRVIDNESVQKVEFYDKFGVKMVINKSDLTEEAWNEFKKNFFNF